MKICFASHNANKVKELNLMLSGKHEIISLKDIGITEDIPETGSSFRENSVLKAQYVHERHGIPVFADDSGLVVDSLDGEPGVYSARYAGDEKDDDNNMNLLLQKLADVSNRSAAFKTVIAYIDEEGVHHYFEGSVSGLITHDKRGGNGFGYDPIFQPIGYHETFAELSQEEKNKISHRAKAVNQLIEHLQQQP